MCESIFDIPTDSKEKKCRNVDYREVPKLRTPLKGGYYLPSVLNGIAEKIKFKNT